MIEFQLKVLLDELNISQTKFAKQANIRPNTINDICNNKTKRIEIETLNNILRTLNIIGNKKYNINDIIIYHHFE